MTAASRSRHDPVGVGIVGLGRAGWGLHARVLEDLTGLYTVIAVADSIAARAATAAAQLGCAGYGSVRQLLHDSRVELVVVAVPTHEHASVAIAALQAGKHVLVEKSVATTLHEFDAMVCAAERAGRLLIGSQNLRYTADFLAIRDIVQSGKLGELLELKIAWHAFRRRWDWQTLRRFGGGIILNDGSHAVDQALCLLGEHEVSVTCYVTRTPLCLGDAEDHAKIVLATPTGVLADIELSNGAAWPDERWRLLASRGGLIGGTSGVRWRYLAPIEMKTRTVNAEPSPDRTYDREDLPWIEESLELAGETYEASHHRLYTALHPTFRLGAPSPISIDSLRRQVAVLERCLRSPLHSIPTGDGPRAVTASTSGPTSEVANVRE